MTALPFATTSGVGKRDLDAALVDRIRSGDSEAIARLWDKYRKMLYPFFLRRVDNFAHAEDLTSETLLDAVRAAPRFRGRSDQAFDDTPTQCTFQTFVGAIARNKVKHWYRDQRARGEVRFADMPRAPGDNCSDWLDTAMPHVTDDNTDPLAHLTQSARSEEICLALAAIESSCQFEVMVLHYLADLTHQDIATVLGTRSETVNSRLQDGRRSLRRCLELMDRAQSES